MGGRGRGRGGGGRAGMSFNVEELGFRRGDALPVSQLAPPPLFPPLTARPAPFEETEELKYLQVLKEDFRTTMSKSPHFLKVAEAKNSIERYSDRFNIANPSAIVADDEEEERRLWYMPDKFFPAELREAPKKRKKRKKAKEIKKKEVKGDARYDVASKLEELEKKEGDGEAEEEEDEDATTSPKKKKPNKEAADGEKDEDDEDDDDEEGEGDGDNEVEEEMGGNDYEQNYFDNGEDEANTSEDNLDEGGTY